MPSAKLEVIQSVRRGRGWHASIQRMERDLQSRLELFLILGHVRDEPERMLELYRRGRLVRTERLDDDAVGKRGPLNELPGGAVTGRREE